MSYDFTTLSPSDFEELVADLLSKEWHARLEIFKEGKDSGVDLLNSRVPAGQPKTIVQCKRYGPSKFSQLVASMTKERSKLDKINPQRYVLVTSVPLSKKNKESLLALLRPYCSATSDIYGADEVNSLLRAYPAVEQAHFKLWISSSAVLERVLNAKVFAVTDATIEATMLEVRKLVPHEGLNRALEVLNKHRHVLIVGNPGIGKTTLARMLLCHFLRDDFEPVWVVGNIGEAWGIVHGAAGTARKLVLVYDDFLGQLEFSSKRFEKNEDHSLFLLMDKVAKSDNLRLILTTREYILEDAKRVHGAFSAYCDELKRCAISLGDYSDAARSKVLFNHLYFSDLPDSRMAKLLATEVYKKIVRHRHFNPRVVETISKDANSHVLDDDAFIAFIEQEFENPAKLWEHPFNQEISQLSRQLLVALWSYGRTTTLPELQCAVEAMNPSVSAELLVQQFLESMRQLDGNFISTNRLASAWRPDDLKHKVVRFQNPSVREFVQNVVTKNAAWLLRVAESMQSFDQIEEVLSTAEAVDGSQLGSRFWGALRASAARVETTERVYEMNCGKADGSSYPALFSEKQLLADVAHLLLRIETHIPTSDSRMVEIKGRVSTLDGWAELLSDMSRTYEARGTIERLVTWLNDDSGWRDLDLQQVNKSFAAAAFALLRTGQLDDMWNIRTLVDCLSLSIDDFSPEEVSIIIGAISESAHAIAMESDADQIGEQLDLLEDLAERFNIDLEKEKDRLKERMDEVDERHQSDAYSRQATKSYATVPEDGFDVDVLFKGLLDRNA